MSRKDLRQRVLIVTGASSGIGEATAVEAARAGMRVVLAARRREKLDAVADRVREAGGEPLVVPTDVTDPAQTDQLIQRTLETFGRLDAFFANAGAGSFDETVEAEPEAERSIWRINYTAMAHGLRAAARVMRRQGHGHLLVNCSVLSFTGLAYHAAYCATKAAAHALTVSLMLELEPEGIDVTGVYPTGTRTEFFQQVARRRGLESEGGNNTPEIFMQSAGHVARRIVAALRRPRPEVWPARLMHLVVAAWVLMPRFRRFCLRFHARDARCRYRALTQNRPTGPEPPGQPDPSDAAPSAPRNPAPQNPDADDPAAHDPGSTPPRRS